MQDVSRVTGNPVIIKSKVKGREFILRGLTFDDLGVLQSEMLREKRKRKVETATEMVKQLGDAFPLAERMQILSDARREADEIAFVSDAEFSSFLNTMDGGIALLWTLFERQHPGAITKSELMQMVASGELGDESLHGLVNTLVGGGDAGNATGQSEAADTPAAAVAT